MRPAARASWPPAGEPRRQRPIGAPSEDELTAVSKLQLRRSSHDLPCRNSARIEAAGGELRGRRGRGAGTAAAIADGMQIAEELSPDVDVAAALCHEITQPLSCLLASLERAHRALARQRRTAEDQPLLHFAHSLADAEATAQHIARVVADVHGRARREPRRMRQLDLRAAVRAAAAMAQSDQGRGAAISVDAPLPAWVDGVDTRLVHVFLYLFADALDQDAAVAVTVRPSSDEVVAQLRRVPGAAPAPRPASATEVVSRALGRAVTRQIIAAHGGQLVESPAASDGTLARVTLPLAKAARPSP
jgi:C4-dicarboxylate-specific signal transduction histidine kinase